MVLLFFFAGIARHSPPLLPVHSLTRSPDRHPQLENHLAPALATRVPLLAAVSATRDSRSIRANCHNWHRPLYRHSRLRSLLRSRHRAGRSDRPASRACPSALFPLRQGVSPTRDRRSHVRTPGALRGLGCVPHRRSMGLRARSPRCEFRHRGPCEASPETSRIATMNNCARDRPLGLGISIPAELYVEVGLALAPSRKIDDPAE